MHFTRAMGRTFDAEEMLAIREQYEERIAEVEARREELEWEVRRVLAVVRDAELRARSAADDIERVYGALRRLVEGGGAAEAPVTPSPARAVVSGVIAPKPAPVAVAAAPVAVAKRPSTAFVATKTAALLLDDDVTEIRAPGEEEHTAVEAPKHDITAVDAARPSPAPKLVGKKLDETPVKVVRRPVAAPPPIPSAKPAAPVAAAAKPVAPSPSASSPSLRGAVPTARRSSFADDTHTDVMGVRPAPVGKPAAAAPPKPAPVTPSPSPTAPNGKPLLGYRRLVA